MILDLIEVYLKILSCLAGIVVLDTSASAFQLEVAIIYFL